jgi:Tol biopolymer transport system component
MLVTPPDAPAINRALAWTPGSDALIFSSSNDREFIAVARHDLAEKELTWLITDDTADLTGWLSPDGAVLLVERNDDGASELALYEAAATDRKVRDLALPAVGTVSSPRLADPRWAPDSRSIALSISSPELPGDALLLDVGFLDASTGGNQVRRLTHSASAFGADDPVLPEQHRLRRTTRHTRTANLCDKQHQMDWATAVFILRRVAGRRGGGAGPGRGVGRRWR